MPRRFPCPHCGEEVRTFHLMLAIPAAIRPVPEIDEADESTPLLVAKNEEP